MAKQRDKIVTIRAAAFNGCGVRKHRCSVDADGVVRVWDPIAKHFTRCHSLSSGAVAKARRLAQSN